MTTQDNFDDELFSVEDDTHLFTGNTDFQILKWKVLVVDDDEDVHTSTEFALNGQILQRRLITFLHAHCINDAVTLLRQNEDIAVVLLDVVMDTGDDGLQLVRIIREDLKMHDVRIVLRTAQAGYAPQIDAIRDYDINDYKNKSELTQSRLYTTITAALRSYEQIRSISQNNLGLKYILQANSELIQTSELDHFAEIVLKVSASLLQIDASGFVCAFYNAQHLGPHKSATTFSGLRVLEGNNEYVNWKSQYLVDVASKPMMSLIHRCIYGKQHQFGTHYTLLYLSNSSDFHLAVYFNRTLQCLNTKKLLELFFKSAQACLDNISLKFRMKKLAFFDPLTGLANRVQLLEKTDEILQSEMREESVLALIDIDHFAETNNALGHEFGDIILKAVADRLQQHFSESCEIARVGVDIFAVIGHEEFVTPEFIFSIFRDAFALNQQTIQLSVTIGLIQLAGYELQGSDAFKDANIALKRAKQNQRSSYFYFTLQMGVEIRERVRMMHALRNAIDFDHLFVVYQPQINMSTGKLYGFEALIRWKTEDGEFVPPIDFIPIAEYSGLIINLGEWVLRSACLELAQIHKLGFTNTKMAVNVSQAQFTNPNFITLIKEALRLSDISPQYLELEITESMAMSDPDVVNEIMHRVRKLGVNIAIDDFGTGFSSLSYLQKLPVNKLKIDRSFVNNIHKAASDSSIARMIVDLSKSLEIEVLAEGVENEEQSQILCAYGCDLAQGHYFAKPQTSDEIRTWLQSHRTT